MSRAVRPQVAERPNPPAGRFAATGWQEIAGELDMHGCAILRDILSADECSSLAASYSDDRLFRSRTIMSRHGFGRGEYKYFAYPLPAAVAALRSCADAPESRASATAG